MTTTGVSKILVENFRLASRVIGAERKSYRGVRVSHASLQKPHPSIQLPLRFSLLRMLSPKNWTDPPPPTRLLQSCRLGYSGPEESPPRYYSEYRRRKRVCGVRSATHYQLANGVERRSGHRPAEADDPFARITPNPHLRDHASILNAR